MRSKTSNKGAGRAAAAAIIVVACEESSMAAGPFHTTKAEDLTAAGPTRPSRVGTWPEQGRRVAEKPHNQDENSVTSDFEARVAPPLALSLRCGHSVFLSSLLPLGGVNLFLFGSP